MMSHGIRPNLKCMVLCFSFFLASCGAIEESRKDLKDSVTLIHTTYTDLRKQGASVKRDEALKHLIQEKDIGSKLARAAQYYTAFEFQSFRPQIEDEELLRGLYFSEAITEYFPVVRQFISDHNQTKVLSFSPKAASNTTLNLYALAAMMDFMGNQQAITAYTTGMVPKSLLDIVAESLIWGKEVRDGTRTVDQLPAYSKEVLFLEQDALYLLRVRQNILMTLGVAFLASSDTGNNPSLFQVAKLLGSSVFRYKWKPNLKNRTDIQLNRYAEFFEKALATRKLLKRIGVDPETDERVVKVLNQIELNPASLSDSQKLAQDPALSGSLLRLKSAIKSVTLAD